MILGDGFDALAEAGDEGTAVGHCFLDGGELEGGLMGSFVGPDFGDPEGVGVVLIVGDEVVEAVGHIDGGGGEEGGEGGALVGMGDYLSNETVHRFTPLSDGF